MYTLVSINDINNVVDTASLGQAIYKQLDVI